MFETSFAENDILCFGNESQGLPPELLAAYPDRRVYVPIRPDVRSLNLANVVCLGAYTAMSAAGLPLPSNDGKYVPHPQAADGIQPADIVRARTHDPC